MHTESIASTDLIRAAIVAQLAKPPVSQSPFWQITALFKYHALIWIGIIGSSIALFVRLNTVLDMADWAKQLVSHWHYWSQLLWEWVFVPKEYVPFMSFITFSIILTIGALWRLS